MGSILITLTKTDTDDEQTPGCLMPPSQRRGPGQSRSYRRWARGRHRGKKWRTTSRLSEPPLTPKSLGLQTLLVEPRPLRAPGATGKTAAHRTVSPGSKLTKYSANCKQATTSSLKCCRKWAASLPAAMKPSSRSGGRATGSELVQCKPRSQSSEKESPTS